MLSLLMAFKGEKKKSKIRLILDLLQDFSYMFSMWKKWGKAKKMMLFTAYLAW